MTGRAEVMRKDVDGSEPGPGAVRAQRLTTIDSTNLQMRRMLAGSPPPELPLALLATEQTGGIGQRGSRWHSPAGGVWLTLGWPANGPGWAHDGLRAQTLAIRCGLAVAEAIDEACGAALAERAIQAPSLKWPNDVMLAGRKVAGVLVERAGDALLIGVGVNAAFPLARLPAELRETATTLFETAGFGQASGQPAALAAAVLERLATTCSDEPVLKDLIGRLNGRLFGRGSAVQAPGAASHMQEPTFLFDGLASEDECLRVSLRDAQSDRVVLVHPGRRIVWLEKGRSL